MAYNYCNVNSRTGSITIAWFLPIDTRLTYVINQNEMEHPQISINYNGHKTAVTVLPNSRFLVQITTNPYYIRVDNFEDDSQRWVEEETNRETRLAKEIGKLIEEEMAG